VQQSRRSPEVRPLASTPEDVLKAPGNQSANQDARKADQCLPHRLLGYRQYPKCGRAWLPQSKAASSAFLRRPSALRRKRLFSAMSTTLSSNSRSRYRSTPEFRMSARCSLVISSSAASCAANESSCARMALTALAVSSSTAETLRQLADSVGSAHAFVPNVPRKTSIDRRSRVAASGQ
jgi:hypothetical protein